MIQSWKIFYTLAFAPFFNLFLVLLPTVGPWNCVMEQNVCVIGPYSPQWYAFYHFFSLVGYTPEVILFCMIDTGIILVIGNVESLPYSLIASMGGFFFLFYDPGDLLIYWLVLLSRGHWFLSIAGALTKLPIGASLTVWRYVWEVSLPTVNPSIPLSPLRWMVLGAFALQPLWTGLFNRWKRKHAGAEA